MLTGINVNKTVGKNGPYKLFQGLVPNHAAQRIVARAASGSSTSIRLLLNLILHSNSDPVSVCAAYTLGKFPIGFSGKIIRNLATLILGNGPLTKELESDPDWTFLHLIKLYYSADPEG